MKRFFNWMLLAALLGAVSCHREKPAPTEEPVFPETEWTGVVTEEAPYSFTVTPVPNLAWTVSIPEQEYFSLSDETTPRYSVSGPAMGEAVITVYATAVVPTQIQTCDVTLTMDEISRKIATVTRMGSESASFEIHLAVPVAEYDGEDLFAKDENGSYVYADAAVTAFDMVADDQGEKNYQQRFQVISEKDWDITEKPVWMAIYDRNANDATSGEAGAVERFAVADDELRPFTETTEQLVFTEKTDASNAAVLATIDVTVPGCGDFISANWGKTTLFNASGEIYNENSGGFTSYASVIIRAPYGSEVFFVAADNWIDFAGKLEWQKEDYYGNDLTVRGVQMVVGEVSCDFNGDESRTAYLVGIPVNQVKEGYTAAKAVNEDGTVAKGYEQFILSTITQIAAPSDAYPLVKWAWSDDEIGRFDRDDFATLETIRPANGEDERTQYFAREWATASVAYALSYKNLEAISVAGLDVVEHASVEVYGPEGPWAETQLSPAWVEWDAEEGIIMPAYDFDKNSWKTETPDDYTAFFVFKDEAGQVITWILFTLEPEHYVPGEPKELIEGAICENGSVQLFNLNAGEPGYDANYAGVPQYKLEMINAASVSFSKVPSGRHQVWGAEDDAEHEEWFRRIGNTFVVETESDDAAMTFYVIFLDNAGAPVAVLYVDYLYGNPVVPLQGFGGARGIDNMGIDEGEAKLTELKAGDHGYDADMAVPQYLLEVSGCNFVQFETFPAGIDDFWSDGDEVDYQAGILSFFPNGGEAEFDVVYKKGYESVALMHVHYSGAEGDTDKTDAAFVLTAESISNGATVRLTTPEDEWWTPYAGDAEQWTLIVNRADPTDDNVMFYSFPSVEEEPMVIGDYEYFELNPQGNLMVVMLLGEAWGEVTSAQYTVFFYDPVYRDVAYRLVVRFNMDGADEPGTGGETGGELFALAEGNASGVTLRKTTESDTWYMSALDYDQWTLIVKGASDMVMFSAVPNLEGLMVLQDMDNEHGYFEIEKQGAAWIASLAGDAYDAGKASYDVVFYDPQWEDPYCRLHVDWSK